VVEDYSPRKNDDRTHVMPRRFGICSPGCFYWIVVNPVQRENNLFGPVGSPPPANAARRQTKRPYLRGLPVFVNNNESAVAILPSFLDQHDVINTGGGARGEHGLLRVCIVIVIRDHQ
jgi:hypothetical protein